MAMHPGMKMLMLNKVVKPNDDTYRSEYGGDTNRRMIGYDRDYETENRRSMEGNRMAYGMDEPEARRRRDSRGRYMMGGNPRMIDDDYDEEEMRTQTWYPPHMRGGGSSYGFGDVYAHIQAPNAMNRPGMMGGAYSMDQPVDEHTARMWVEKMDGGEHFKPEQVEQLRHTICPECNKWEFYTAMNAMYSDHCESAKKMGMDKPDFYAHMAKDFLMDSDAKLHKLRRYMEMIAK